MSAGREGGRYFAKDKRRHVAVWLRKTARDERAAVRPLLRRSMCRLRHRDAAAYEDACQLVAGWQDIICWSLRRSWRSFCNREKRGRNLVDMRLSSDHVSEKLGRSHCTKGAP